MLRARSEAILRAGPLPAGFRAGCCGVGRAGIGEVRVKVSARVQMFGGPGNYGLGKAHGFSVILFRKWLLLTGVAC